MTKIIKTVLITTLMVVALGFGVYIMAQDDTTADTTAATTTADEQISAQDLGVSEPALLPDSPFYFLKEWTRKIRVILTFNVVKKVELESKFANEKLVELKKLVEKNVNTEIIKKATENYQNAIDKIKERADKIKEKAANNETVNKFLEKFTNQQVLHEKILQKLETQVPQEVFEKIKEAREQHLERFKDVMTKLEENKERIAEKIKNALQNGDESNPEILEKIKEKMPEEIKEKLIEVKEKIVEKTIEKVVEKNENKNCPVITKPAPDFCKQGKIKIQRDQKGCATGFNCLIPSKQKVCTQEYNPVCGEDGKTYSNKCTAKLSNIEIAYQGECGIECKTDADCPQPQREADLTGGVVPKCIRGRCQEPKNDCKNLWWFDNEHPACSKKQFCGTYMYLGLRTFETEQSCIEESRTVFPPTY